MYLELVDSLARYRRPGSHQCAVPSHLPLLSGLTPTGSLADGACRPLQGKLYSFLLFTTIHVCSLAFPAARWQEYRRGRLFLLLGELLAAYPPGALRAPA